MVTDRNAKSFFVSRASANSCKIVDCGLLSVFLFFIVDLFRKPGNPDVAASLTEIEDPYKWKHFLLLGLDSGKKSNFTIMKNEQNRTLFKKVLGYCSYIV